MSHKTEIGFDSYARLNILQVDAAKLSFYYSGDTGTVQQVTTRGRFTADTWRIIDLLNRKYIDQINVIRSILEILHIGTIDELTYLAEINHITLIDGITTIGTITNAVNVGTMPNVVISSMPNAVISSMPNVTIGSMPNVTIASMPAVTIAAAQSVNIGNAPTVDIDGQEVNIKTTGGTNLIIDKLTQGAYRDKAIADVVTYTIADDDTPINSTTSTYLSAYFARGMRGRINQINIHGTSAAGAKSAVIGFRVTPESGELFTVTVPNINAAGWYGVTVAKEWNYDSMFVYVKQATDADLSFGYINVGNLHSGDSGATWAYRNTYAVCFRLYMVNQTVGDLPISGTVNNIPLPNVASTRAYTGYTIAALTETLDTIILGAGETLTLMWFTAADGSAGDLRPRLYCDGVSVMPIDVSVATWLYWLVAMNNGWTCTKPTGTEYHILLCTIRFPFKKSVQIGFYNGHAATTRYGNTSIVVSKIS